MKRSSEGRSEESREVSGRDAPPEPETSEDLASSTTGATVLRGGAWSVSSRVLPQAFTLAVSIAGARFLGASGLGRQSFIAFVATSVIYVLGFGIPIALMRQLGESIGAGHSGEGRGLVKWSWRFAIVGALVGLAVMLGITIGGAKPYLAWLLAAFTVPLGVLTQIPDAVLSGLQRWRDNSLIVLGTAAAGAAATIVVLALGGGITGMIAVQLGVAIVILGLMAPIARMRLRVAAPQSADPGKLRRQTLQYAGSVFIGSLVTLIVFRRSEFFFLDRYGTSKDIALYSVAFSMMSTLVLLPQALTTAVTPAVATMFGARRMDRIRTGYSRTLRLLLLGALPIAAAGLALGPELLTLLFGPVFRASGPIIVILLIPFPLIPLMDASYSVIVGLRKAKFPIVAGLSSAVINIGLDIALIPRYHTEGAAMANAIAQGATAIAIVIYGVVLVGGVRWQMRSLTRMLVISACAGVAAWQLVSVVGGVVGLICGAAGGVVVFVVLAFGLRFLPREDARWLRDEFGSGFGGRIGILARRLETS